MLPVARELHFNQGVDAAAGLVTRLQHQRRGCVRLLAIWEEIVEMQQQARVGVRVTGLGLGLGLRLRLRLRLRLGLGLGLGSAHSY